MRAGYFTGMHRMENNGRLLHLFGPILFILSIPVSCRVSGYAGAPVLALLLKKA